jgi:hypothetical protein
MEGQIDALGPQKVSYSNFNMYNRCNCNTYAALKCGVVECDRSAAAGFIVFTSGTCSIVIYYIIIMSVLAVAVAVVAALC